MRRLPNNALASAIYRLLSAHIQNTPITDHVDDSITLPYIVIGNVTSNETREKAGKVLRCTLELHIFSDYRGKAEVDSIGETICDILNDDSTIIDMAADHWEVVDGGIDGYETYEEDMYGYGGTLTIKVTVQDIT